MKGERFIYFGSKWVRRVGRRQGGSFDVNALS